MNWEQRLLLPSMLRAQYRSRARLDSAIELKLRAIVHHAYDTVPYYRDLLDGAGVKPHQIRSPADLSQIPVTRKQDLQTAGANRVTSQAFESDELTREMTSGSSGRPFEIRFDPQWMHTRKAMFLRALMAAGYRPGHRLLLIASQKRARPPAWLRWQHISYKSTPAELVAALNRFRPVFLYGWVTPIRRMAELIREGGERCHSPRAVVTTAETLDASTRELIEKSFDSKVHEIYGMTEMGAMTWECGEHDGLHIAEDVVITEFLPHESRADMKRLITTNLELRGMPFLRYDCGDLAISVPDSNEPCGCGRTFKRLGRVEGRMVDCITLTNGQVFSPYELTLAMERVPGVARYQIVQTHMNRLEVSYVVQPDGRAEATEGAIRQVMGRLLGADMHISVQSKSSIDPPPGSKFRVVESWLDRAPP